jgi:phosphoserine aminotransferase
LPTGGHLEQADGTAWMAFYCATMLSMALELAQDDPTYEDIASKFFEHFVHIADAMNCLGGTGLWDEEDGFYYDRLHVGGTTVPLGVRSIVGVIPLFAVEVLEQAQAELLDWRGKGLSVMEMSHRSAEFIDIATTAERDFRELLGVPENYKVLFLQGGASQQFAAIPLNLMAAGDTADYVSTGAWSEKAIAEARRHGNVNVAASSADENFTYVPPRERWNLTPGAAYVHYCANETIGGVEFHEIPDVGAAPLVSDMSSTLLSRPVDVGRFGVIYAGAQKNIGPAGLVIVVVREDLLGRARPDTPSMLDFAVHAKNESMYNTPPTFSWYMAGLVFQWLKQLGGLAAAATLNRRKADKLYGVIDNSNFYRCPVVPANRSWMNVPFTLADAALDKPFLAGADEAGLVNLEGHRSVGGMRASLYNAVPEAAVDALIDYMQDFESRHG